MSKDLNSVTILKTDTPRTCDLKTLRAKRLAYFVDRNHNCTDLSRDVGSLGPNDKQVNTDHRVADPERENVPNAEQNVPLVEKECHINELIQHARAEDTRQVRSRDLETLLNISESDGKDSCMPRPDYNFLENPSVSEIQKLRHILCWAQEILKKDKNDSHTQAHQSTMNINETELAESHLNTDASQTTTFNCSSHTNKFVHKAAVNSALDEAKCSADISSESFNSFDLLRQHKTLVPTSSFIQSDVQEQCTSVNIGLSSNCHFDSSNTFERKYAEQVHAYNASNNKWKFKDSGESKELVTELSNETCHSMTSNVSALNKGNYFWIPLEAGSDDEYITENRQVNEVFMEPFVKSNSTPLLCSSNNNYHNNNGEPTLSARTVTLRKCPETYNNSGDVSENPVNLHYMIQHHISSNNQNNNGEPTLSDRAVTLKTSPVAYSDSSGDIFANPVNLHNGALHYKSRFCDEGKRNYAWETKKAEEYFSGGDHEISLGHSKIADVPGLSANLDDAGFNFKSPFAPKCIIESSNEKQDSEDNPIPNPDVATVPLGENIPGVSILHCTFQEKSYLEQDSNVETSKNILHSATLKQNFGNQNFSSLEYENNKETLKDADKNPRKKRKVQSSINQYQRCWEKSSIAWSSYTQGAIKARSANLSHPRSVADCPRTKGKPLLPDDHSTVPMAMSKASLKQPFKRPLSANILDNKRGRQRSKTLLQNTAVASGPTMKSSHKRINHHCCGPLLQRRDPYAPRPLD
ncbi:uncharacterized protein [Mobula birostris]|uniref:uncharacterized protein isoform X5 n=1 Tax=Mobula birostris TaxID=1983395 RepID=UPI003B27B784